MAAEKMKLTITRMSRLRGIPVGLLRLDRPGAGASGDAVGTYRAESRVLSWRLRRSVLSSRVLADLRADGEIIFRDTIAKTMRRLGLVGICPKKWKKTTTADRADAYPLDAVKREWDTGALNRVWVGDVAYLRLERWDLSRDRHRCSQSPGHRPLTCVPM